MFRELRNKPMTAILGNQTDKILSRFHLPGLYSEERKKSLIGRIQNQITHLTGIIGYREFDFPSSSIKSVDVVKGQPFKPSSELSFYDRVIVRFVVKKNGFIDPHRLHLTLRENPVIEIVNNRFPDGYSLAAKMKDLQSVSDLLQSIIEFNI